MPMSSIKTGHCKDEESRRLAFAPLTVPICAKPSDGKVGTSGVHPFPPMCAFNPVEAAEE